MNKEPLVSIMMPVYNGINQLPKSIKSIQNQTYKNWKCIIVNDGSTDGTKEYLNRLSDSRFIIHHFEKNKGRPYARQKALELAEGKYLAMLDADDWYFEDKISSQVDFLEKNTEIDLVSGGMILTNKNNEPTVHQTVDINLKIKKSYNYNIPHAPSMLKLDKAKKHKYDPKLLLGQDQDFIKKYLSNSSKYKILPTTYYVYNVGASFSIKKYIKTNWLNLTQNKHQLVEKAVIILKIIYAYSLLILNSPDSLIKNRGEKISKDDLERFNKLKESLN